MQTLFKILLRYSNFLVFIALEVAAFILVCLNNAYPRSSMLSTANTVIAWQHEKISNISDYFDLERQNEELAQANAALRNQMSLMDSLRNGEVITYKASKVVQMTSTELHNYLTINVGSNDGVERGQGVRNADGAIGIICTVGPHYSVVLPITNTNFNLSCRIAKNDYVATLKWDGEDHRFAQLEDVDSHVGVQVGDTIVTSGLSPVFPEGIPVGIVEKSILNAGDSYYSITVRLQADFKRLRYVEVVQNANKKEMEDLVNGLE